MTSDTTDQPAIDFDTAGSGEPTTCFVPGIGQTTSQTRPFASGVAGRKVFATLRGHGTRPVDTQSSDDWSYELFAADVAGVVAVTSATRGVGVSLGSNVLLQLVAGQPALLERVVLALPGRFSGPRDPELVNQANRIADAIDANDQIALAQRLLLMQPPNARSRADVRMWARRHAAAIGGSAVSRAFWTFPQAATGVAESALAEIAVPVLVLAQRDDPWHPVEAATQLASAIPNAQLVLSEVPWVWGARDELRTVISEFLNT